MCRWAKHTTVSHQNQQHVLLSLFAIRFVRALLMNQLTSGFMDSRCMSVAPSPHAIYAAGIIQRKTIQNRVCMHVCMFAYLAGFLESRAVSQRNSIACSPCSPYSSSRLGAHQPTAGLSGGPSRAPATCCADAAGAVAAPQTHSATTNTGGRSPGAAG